MRKKKTVVFAVVTMMVMTVLTLPVSATSVIPPATQQGLENHTVTPCWISTTLVVPSIAKSGRNISVSLFIAPKKSVEKSSGILYLEQYRGGRWQAVKSWTISQRGTVAITKSYTGKNKVKYRTKVVVTTGSDKITATSTELIL